MKDCWACFARLFNDVRWDHPTTARPLDDLAGSIIILVNVDFMVRNILLIEKSLSASARTAPLC